MKHSFKDRSEEDWAKRRETMVADLAARGIRSESVLKAMRRVLRHRFVPEPERAHAYEDAALLIGEEQTISQPLMVGLMSEAAKLEGSEKVLEVGTGSGYQAAILAELAKQVFSIERNRLLYDRARELFETLSYPNLTLIYGDGTQGYQGGAPYDRILVTAGSPSLPEPLLEQLSPGGFLIAPVGDRQEQVLMRAFRTQHGGIEVERMGRCKFVPLIGAYGWQPEKGRQ